MELFEKFVYVNENSLSIEICNEIINLFENDDTKRPGETMRGIFKHVKDTSDLDIYNNEPKWSKINNLLINELQYNCTKYVENCYEFFRNKSIDYRPLSFNHLDIIALQIQKYIKKEGKYIYHHDGSIDYKNQSKRVLTYLWYLNTVNEGGETEILGNIKIKPVAGKLLLFPACWTFPHSGLTPISNDKYILTGWLYSNDD